MNLIRLLSAWAIAIALLLGQMTLFSAQVTGLFHSSDEVKNSSSPASKPNNSIRSITEQKKERITYQNVYSDVYPIHPGFPVSIPGRVNRSSPTIVDLENDGNNELFVATYGGEVYAWDASGSLLNGYPLSTGGPIIGHLAFGDVNNDNLLEIVAGVSTIESGQQGKVYIWQSDGKLLDNWPKSIARFGDVRPSRVSTVVIEDIDGDNELEIIAGTNNNVLGIPDPPDAVPDLYVWDYTGNLMDNSSWPAEDRPAILGTIAVGDLNSDASPDIIVGRDYHGLFAYDNQGVNLPGWPLLTFLTQDNNYSDEPRIEYKLATPTLADLDNNGKFEYIVAGIRKSSTSTQVINTDVLVFEPDGTRSSGWEIPASGAGLTGTLSSMQQGIAIADINSDNRLDIIVTTQDGWIRSYKYDKTLLWEFDYAQDEMIYGTEAVIGDIDQDNLYEVIFGAYEDEPGLGESVGLWILEDDGTPKFETPLPVDDDLGIKAPPSLADFDNDGLLEIIAASRQGKIYVWDTPSPFNPFRLPWSMARHDLQRTGSFDDARFDAVKTASSYLTKQGEVVTYTVRMERTDAPLTYTVQLTDIIPSSLNYISGTLTATQGIVNDDLTPTLSWLGRLSDTNLLTITYSVFITTEVQMQPITNVAMIDSLATGLFTRTSVIFANPEEIYLPNIFKEFQ